MIVQNAGIVPCDDGNGSSTEEPRTALVAEPQQVPESLSIEGMFHLHHVQCYACVQQGS